MKVIGYLRVSTREQGDSGAGLAAQRRRIDEEAERRGWTVRWAEDVGSGKDTRRDGLQTALETLRAGDAGMLVVAKLDRVSRSVSDFARLLDRARKEGWQVVALDIGVDTSTAVGELVANVMMSVAQWERRVIGQRTAEGLAEVRERGVKLGRPRVVDAGLADCVACYRADGLSLREIAAELTTAGVPTPRGGRVWHAETVRQILRRSAAA